MLNISYTEKRILCELRYQHSQLLYLIIVTKNHLALISVNGPVINAVGVEKVNVYDYTPHRRPWHGN